MTKHTPEPWWVHTGQGNREKIIVAGLDTSPFTATIIAYGTPDRKSWEANAELIVRAVNSHEDLLTALEELIDCPIEEIRMKRLLKLIDKRQRAKARKGRKG